MNKGKKRRCDNSMEEDKQTDNCCICELCKVELPKETYLKQHLFDQKHRKLYTAEEERKKVENKCGIFVRGFSPDITKHDILNYFSKYGKVFWVHFGDKFILLDFAEPSAAKEVTKNNHYLAGKRLVVKYRELRQKVQIKKPEEEDPSHIICSLKDILKFDAQVQMLIQNLQPRDKNHFPKYRHICTDLYNVLSPAFPYCQIHPFGSTITGLNFNNSDIDVFISGIKSNDDDVPYLYKTKKLLLMSRRFANIIVIPNAKIPILKCVHLQTCISCDINLRNMLGVCNSQLINYFLDINPKIRWLMMVLKYWAKVHKISGQNNLFSNYSLTLMLIFFLQQEPYNIPSVLSLQQNPRFFNFQDGWNGGFQPIPYFNHPLHNASLLKLLEGFFIFYSEFDYGVNLICPYLGRSLKKDDFTTPEKLPSYFSAYKQYIQFGTPLKIDNTICIQDPFEHSRNTTPIVSISILNIFVSFCRLGKRLCAETENALLYKLLKEIPKNVKSELVVTPDYSQFFIPMQPSLKYIENKYGTAIERQNAWFNCIVEFTTIVLKDFLKFELSEQSTPLKDKNRRLEGQSDVHEINEKNEVSYNCLGKLNLWQARKATAKDNTTENIQSPNSIIEKEIAITNKLYSLYKDIPQTADVINFKITLEYNIDVESPGVIIKLKKNAAYKKSFKSFALFLSSNLPSWFNVYEKEQNYSLHHEDS